MKKTKAIINETLLKYGNKAAISCSFGKDSITVVHLGLQIKKDIPIDILHNKLFYQE